MGLTCMSMSGLLLARQAQQHYEQTKLRLQLEIELQNVIGLHYITSNDWWQLLCKLHWA